MSRLLNAIASQKKWRSVPASHRFKAFFRWHNPAIGCRIKQLKEGSHLTASFTPAMYYEKENPSKSGRPALPGH